MTNNAIFNVALYEAIHGQIETIDPAVESRKLARERQKERKRKILSFHRQAGSTESAENNHTVFASVCDRFRCDCFLRSWNGRGDRSNIDISFRCGIHWKCNQKEKDCRDVMSFTTSQARRKPKKQIHRKNDGKIEYVYQRYNGGTYNNDDFIDIEEFDFSRWLRNRLKEW